jgi:lipopolysaccharide export system permease protein
MYLLIVIGIIGQIATFFVSGFVEPQARFAQRLLFYRAESHVLVSGLVAGQLYFFRDTVVYSTATRAGSRPVFIHRWLPDVNRVITAERTRIEESDDQSRLTLYLQNFTSNDFLRVAHQASADRGGTTDATAGYDSVFKRRVQGALVSEPILTDSLQSFQPRGTSLSEWTLPELVGLVPGPAATNKDHLAEAGRRIARALLCLIAPLLAYSAISFTTQRTNFLVLPAACTLLVCIDLSMSAFAKYLALAGLPLLLAGLIVIAGSIAAALAVVSITRQNALVTPGLTNS